jgi:hypothetical protein
MRQRQLVARGLRYYWRTNLAVIAGVATAVAVLAGALLVGDSVRGSLRDLVLQRLGATDAGGSLAQLSRVVAARHPHLQFRSFDLPPVGRTHKGRSMR